HTVRHDTRRCGDRVAVPLSHALRVIELRTRPHRYWPDRLAWQSALGNAGDHIVVDLEAVRIQHADLHRRSAGNTAGLVRRSRDRRRGAGPSLLQWHTAAARPDAARRR